MTAAPVPDVTFLHQEIEHLEARVRELETALSGGLVVPAALGLKPMQSRLLAVLVARPVATFPMLMNAITRGCYTPDRQTVRVHICGLRRALKPHGIAILTRLDVGYEMPAADKARTMALIAKLGASA